MCVCVLWGRLCHAYKMASSLSRHRGGEAITPFARQHNGPLSPHHQSLSQSAPPTRTQNNTHTHIQVHTKHAQTNANTHTRSSHTQWDRSLIMPLILSDSSMYNGWLPGAMCRGIHPFIHPALLLFIIYLLSHPSLHPPIFPLRFSLIVSLLFLNHSQLLLNLSWCLFWGLCRSRLS